MSGELHEITEIMVRKILNNCERGTFSDIIIPESLVSELSEAMRVYGDTLTREATKSIVSMAFALEGYKECGLEVWKLLYQVNHIRVQLLALDPKDKHKVASCLENILTSRGIKIENGDTNAKS